MTYPERRRTTVPSATPRSGSTPAVGRDLRARLDPGVVADPRAASNLGTRVHPCARGDVRVGRDLRAERDQPAAVGVPFVPDDDPVVRLQLFETPLNHHIDSLGTSHPTSRNEPLRCGVPMAGNLHEFLTRAPALRTYWAWATIPLAIPQATGQPTRMIVAAPNGFQAFDGPRNLGR